MTNAPDTMTLADAARLTHMSTDWINKECRAGRIAHVAMGSGSKRFRRLPLVSAIEKLMQEKTRDATRRAYAGSTLRYRLSRMPRSELRY